MSLLVTVGGIAAIVLLTAISAFFSSSELAVFSVPRHRIDSLAAADAPGARALSRLRDDPRRFLVTVLVSNNVANIAAASVATAVLVQYVSPGQAATGATVFGSFFVIVFGEITPKSYAVAHAEQHALRVSRIVVVAQRVLSPILIVFEVTTDAIDRLIGGGEDITTHVTREEIETLVVTGESSGALDADEGTMIRSVLDLEETRVKGVMVPRTAMTGVHLDDTPASAIESCWREHVVRAPVYGENRDDVRGIVDLRDLLRADATGDDIASASTEPMFVPATKPVDELLAEMQRDGVQMVIVVDEFGSVIGLATLEDVIEEVVGEIFDRGDDDPIRVLDAGTAELRGRTTIAYVNEQLGTDLRADGPFETVAGLVNHHLGHLAEEGDRVELPGTVLTVLDVADRRVRRVRIEHGHDSAVSESSGDDPAEST